MEDDDEFSDLYADVLVQASSAISAMHRLTELRPGNDEIFDNATRGEELREVFNGAGIVGGKHKIYERGSQREDVECEGKEGGDVRGLVNLTMESGVLSGSDCEDDWDSGGEDGCKQKFDDNCHNDKYDNRIDNSELGVANTSRHEGGQEIEEDECGAAYGNEKSVDGGDYNSQRKSLNYDSKKRRVDEMARHVDKSCKKGDADMGDGELYFRRGIEVNKRDLGGNNGGPNKASERTLDLDRHGSVQISDSLEDNFHEMSDSESNGMTEATETSYYTSRRKTSSISKKVSSAAESESSESSWSRHGRGPYSPKPSVALSDKYIEKSNKDSTYPSSSLGHESQEAMDRKRYPSRDFKGRGARLSNSDDRYCERQRDNSRNHSNQWKKYNDMSYLKNRQADKDHYNRHIGHGRQRTMDSFDSYENDVPYCGQSKRFLTYLGGFSPDYRLGPNQYWKYIHPSARYKSGVPDGPSMSERHEFLDMSRMDYEALGDDSYHNQKRHPVHENIVGLRRFTPKYSSTAVNQRDSRFISRVDDMNFKLRTKGNYLPPLDKFDKKFVEGKYRRICPSGGRDRDNFAHRCDRNLACSRREMESSRRGKRSHDDIPLNNSDNLWCTEHEVHDSIRRRSSPFYSPEEPCAPGRGKFLGAYEPESGVPERKARCSWKEMHIESNLNGTNIAFSDTRESLWCHHSKDHRGRRRPYQLSSNTHFMSESIKDDHEEDIFVRRKLRQHSEVLHLREEVYKSTKQDDAMFHYEEPSYNLEKNSRNNRTDDRRAFGRVTELVDEREVDRERSIIIREQDSSNQFDGYRKTIQPHIHAQMHPRIQDSVDRLVVVGRKCVMQPASSRRTLEAGQDEGYGIHDLMGRDDNQKSKYFEALDHFHPEKAVSTNEGEYNATLGGKTQLSKFLDIEEGQIITEEVQDLMKRVCPSEDKSQINDEGQPQTASIGNGEVQKLDDEKIQEIMVKMERRRERFKEPIITCRDSAKTCYPVPDLNVESVEANLGRPARKRRWAGTS